MTPKIYLIAGESSGDFIGSQLMQSLKSIITSEFTGIGGPLMSQQGLKSLFPISEISLMGFFEVIPHIFRIKKLINQTIADIIEKSPDLLITIDSPGFTYRVAKQVRQIKPNLKIIHIVAPSVWAYKPGRALKYAKVYDHLLALLPFEPPYFEKVGLNCHYIGHPVLEQKFYHDKVALKSEFTIPDNAKIICVTPGSRKGEILRHMPIFCEALNIVSTEFKNLYVIFVLANADHQHLIEEFLKEAKFHFIFSTDRLKSFAVGDTALAKSGTNTLEIAASETSMIVAYKINTLSFLLISLLIKVRWISLINIVANKEIIPEFIQSNCNPQSIAMGLIDLLTKPQKAQKQLEESHMALNQLGFKNNTAPSDVAARLIATKFLKDYEL